MKPRKNILQAHGAQPPAAPSMPRPQFAPKVLQAKVTSIRQPSPIETRRAPAAPPAYRPQAVPQVLQRKTAITQPAMAKINHAPAAPPVYRPQPIPQVLQTKMAAGQQLSINKASCKPVAPPVYRPGAKKILQPKMAAASQPQQPPKAPPVYRPLPTPRGLQAKMIKSQTVTRPPVYAAALTGLAGRAGVRLGTAQQRTQGIRVIQRMLSNKNTAPEVSDEERKNALYDRLTAFDMQLTEWYSENQTAARSVQQDVQVLFDAFEKFDDVEDLDYTIESLVVRFNKLRTGFESIDSSSNATPSTSLTGVTEVVSGAIGNLNNKKKDFGIKGQQKNLPPGLKNKLRAIKEFIIGAKQDLLHENGNTMIAVTQKIFEARELMEACAAMSTKDEVIAFEVLWKEGVYEDMFNLKLMMDSGVICNEEIGKALGKVA